MRTNDFNNSGIPIRYFSPESASNDDTWDEDDTPQDHQASSTTFNDEASDTEDWNWKESDTEDGWHKPKSKPKFKLLPESSKPKISSNVSQNNDDEDNELKMAILLSQMTDADDEDALQQAILLSQADKPQEDAIKKDKPQDEARSTSSYNKYEKSSLRRRNINTNSKCKRSSLPKTSKPSNYSSNHFTNNNEDEDEALQLAILLSQTQNDAYAEEDKPQDQAPSETSYSSKLLQKLLQNNDDDEENDKELQMAILLSQTQTQTDAATAADEEDAIQQAILLSSQTQQTEDDEDAIQRAIMLSMETLCLSSDNEYCLSSSSSAEARSDWADLIPADSGDLELKGVFRPLEMKPLVNLSRFQLGEASISVCVVCSNEMSTGKMSRLSEKCSHFFCAGCASEYLGRAIKENVQEPRCPGENCREMLPWLKCCAFIPPEVLERRFKALEEAKELMNLAEKKPFESSCWGSKFNDDGWEFYDDRWTPDAREGSWTPADWKYDLT